MGEKVAHPLTGMFDSRFWQGKRVLLTGHTGFIGGWTAAVLHGLGAKVVGYAKSPLTSPSFFALTGLETRIVSIIADLRDRDALSQAFRSGKPDIVLHLAAQSLVSTGYAEPYETFDVNVMGTASLLECVRAHGAGSVVVMTTDKVYRGSDGNNGEDDRLGASDPYGGSKVCCETVAEVYARSFLEKEKIPLATVRAGNVVGGGDWAQNRLIPDAVRAFAQNQPLILRHPQATRPWQHVLDAVNGLLLVVQHNADGSAGPSAWNVGPKVGETMSVGEVADLAAACWGDGARIEHDSHHSFPETEHLAIDSHRIRSELGYAQPWTLPQILNRTMQWYRQALNGGDTWELTCRQIDNYGVDASSEAR